MKITRNLSVFLILFITSINLITGYGCANIVPPSGGPRDSLPPVLVNSSPRDSTTNFNLNNKTIVFTFDEFVNLDKVQQNLIISPTPKLNPLVDSKLRTVTIKIKDTLQPNTTYIFDFGNAIRDVNEGNILRNFSYVFSTGRRLDSLTLSGTVIIAETGKVDSSLIMMLHQNLDDSAVIKDRPRYVARVDTLGRFTFHFLAPGTYNLFALKDEGGTRKYLSKSELFAFYDKPIVIQQINQPVTLFAYSEKEEVKKPAAKAAATAKKEEKEEKQTRLVVETNLANGQLDLLGNLEIKFPVRLKTFDSTKVHFKNGKFEDMTAYQMIRDTSGRKIFFSTKWIPDSAYHLILEKDFAEDSLGKKLLKTDTINIRTKKESDYGEVKLRFKNLDITKNPVLQFVQNKDVKFSFPLTSTQFIKKLFVPGDYDLRILYDDNQNGIWDPGDFFGKHIQPEKAQPIIIPMRNKKRIFSVKANWENDFDFIL